MVERRTHIRIALLEVFIIYGKYEYFKYFNYFLLAFIASICYRGLKFVEKTGSRSKYFLLL